MRAPASTVRELFAARGLPPMAELPSLVANALIGAAALMRADDGGLGAPAAFRPVPERVGDLGATDAFRLVAERVASAPPVAFSSLASVDAAGAGGAKPPPSRRATRARALADALWL